MDKTEIAQKKIEANSQLEKGNFFSAINLYTEILIFDKDPEIMINKADCLIKMKKYEEALEDVKAALEKDPLFLKAYLIGTSIHKIVGNIEKAIDLLNKAFIQLPLENEIKNELQNCKNLQNLLRMITINMEKCNFEEAINFLDTLMKECSSDYSLVSKIIKAYSFGGNLLKARSVLKKHEYNLRHYKENIFFFLNSLVLRFENKRTQAKNMLEKGLKIHKKCQLLLQAKNIFKEIDILISKAEKLTKEKNYRESEIIYDKIIKLDQYNKLFNFDILLKKIDLLANQKKYEEALKIVDLVFTYKENSAVTHKKKAEILRGLKKYVEAEQAIRMANIIDPKLITPAEIREYVKLAKEAKRKDYYKILGIELTEDQILIKKSYRKMAMKYHPDKNRGSEKDLEEATIRFKEISEAYVILSDVDKKRKYDNREDDEVYHEGQGQPFDFNDIFRMFNDQNGNNGNGFTFHFG